MSRPPSLAADLAAAKQRGGKELLKWGSIATIFTASFIGLLKYFEGPIITVGSVLGICLSAFLAALMVFKSWICRYVLPGVLSVVFIGFIAWRHGNLERSTAAQAVAQAALSASQTPLPVSLTFSENISEIEIHTGGVTARIAAGMLRTNKFDPIGGLPIFLYLQGDQLCVEGEINVPTGESMVLSNGVLSFRPPRFDWNKDEAGIEVVNEHREVVFSFDRRTPSLAALRGWFKGQAVSFYLADDAYFGLPNGAPSLAEALRVRNASAQKAAELLPGIEHRDVLPIKPIFKYPSTRYLGVRADP